MASSCLFPPPLALHYAPPAGSGSGSEAQAIDQPPNLMPFSIDYTGPANVDGYLVSHQAKQASSSASSSHNAAQSSSTGLASGLDLRQEEVYTHFRGRRLWRTTLPLPAGWSGRVCLLQRERPRDAPVGVRDGLSQATMGGGAEGGEGEVARRRLEREEEAEREEMRRKKRRLNAAASAAAAANGSGRNGSAMAKKPAAMAGFSMDDDEDENDGDGEGEAGLSEEEDVYDGLNEDEEDSYADPLHEDDDDDGERLQEDDDFLPRGQPLPSSGSASTAPAAPPLPISGTTTSLLPSSRFSSIHVWSPDGKLDTGDEELVKVLGEWRSINALLHSA